MGHLKQTSTSPSFRTGQQMSPFSQASATPVSELFVASLAKTQLILALLLPVFVIAPLFYPGYFQAHSGFVPVWNVVDLRANLGSLGWTPHIATNFDPLRSTGLLPFYLAALLPLPPFTAVKTVIGIGWLLGSVGTYLWLKSWFGRPGALVAALVYTYLPYQIAAVYVRGAWGEALFLGLLPWAILAATHLDTWPRLLIVPATAVCWFLLGMSQLGLTLWAFGFITALTLVVYRRQALLATVAAIIGVVAALSCGLLVSRFSADAPVIFVDHFLYPAQLFSAYWGFGLSRAGWNDGLSLQLGLAGVGLTLLTIILWQSLNLEIRPVSRTDRRLICFLAFALIFSLLQLGLAAFVWRLPIPAGYTLSDTLTYPWQLMGLAGFCLAVLAGAALWLDEQLVRLPFYASIILFVVLSSYSYLEPQFIGIDQYAAAPQAQLGEAELTLLAHNFSVITSGQTAGLERGVTTIPLAVHGSLNPDDTLMLNVIWQPLRSFSRDLKVFVHLVDSNNNLIAQFDGQPRSGDYPTSRWIPGEIIKDSYPILFPEAAPPGPYQIFVGLYDETTMARLIVPADPEGRVILSVE